MLKRRISPELQTIIDDNGEMLNVDGNIIGYDGFIVGKRTYLHQYYVTENFIIWKRCYLVNGIDLIYKDVQLASFE